jgi:hypothetical protein
MERIIGHLPQFAVPTALQIAEVLGLHLDDVAKAELQHQETATQARIGSETLNRFNEAMTEHFVGVDHAWVGYEEMGIAMVDARRALTHISDVMTTGEIGRLLNTTMPGWELTSESDKKESAKALKEWEEIWG